MTALSVCEKLQDNGKMSARSAIDTRQEMGRN